MKWKNWAVAALCAGLVAMQCTSGTKQKTVITISGAWALYPMAVAWAAAFQKEHPEIKLDISAGGAGKGMADCLAGAVDIGMVSREIYPAEIQQGAWWVAVTKDAVVPTMNRNNPLAARLFKRGVRQEELAGIWITGTLKDWAILAQIPDGVPVTLNIYTRSDACGAAQTWAAYFGKKQEDLLGVGVYGDPGLAEAVKKDPLGIGYNNINYAYDTQTKTQLAGLCVLPLDLNGNGTLDPSEDFYNHQDSLVLAIADGRYPSPPARELNFVTKGRPAGPAVQAFLLWVLTDGQRLVPGAGYINLTQERLAQERRKLQGL